jgi:hypothetical protein
MRAGLIYLVRKQLLGDTKTGAHVDEYARRWQTRSCVRSVVPSLLAQRAHLAVLQGTLLVTRYERVGWINERSSAREGDGKRFATIMKLEAVG